MNEKKKPSKIVIFGVIFFAFCFGLIIFAPDKKDDTSSDVKTAPATQAETKAIAHETEEETEATTEKPKTNVIMTGHHLTKDKSDNDILVVEYDFYNGEDKAKSFSWTFTDKCFQNGVECSNLVLFVDEIDTQKQTADILPGTTLHFSVGYQLDDMSDVTVIVSKYLTDEEYINETFSPQS